MSGALTRRPDWDARLLAYAGARLGAGYQWGATDCGTLLRGAVAAMYGADPWAALPAYATAAGALRTRQRVGGVAGALITLGAAAVPLTHLQRGDVVLFPLDAEELDAVGIVLDRALLTTHPDTGVVLGALDAVSTAARAYRLPLTLAGDWHG